MRVDVRHSTGALKGLQRSADALLSQSTVTAFEQFIGVIRALTQVPFEPVGRHVTDVHDPLFITFAEDLQFMGDEVNTAALQLDHLADTASGGQQELDQSPVTCGLARPAQIFDLQLTDRQRHVGPDPEQRVDHNGDDRRHLQVVQLPAW